MEARDFREPMRQTELELIVETIPDAVAVVDRSGRITFVNRTAEKVLGLSRREICIRTYNAPKWKITTVDGEPYPQGELPFDLVMREGKPVDDVELSIERPDGKRVMLSVNAAPIRDARGTIIGVVHSLTDITKRKMAESALQESEQRFRSLLEDINLAALILDTYGKIVFANDFLLGLIGRTRASVIGKDMFDLFVPEEEREELRLIFLDSIARQEVPAHFEYDIVTEEGEPHTISYSNVLLRDMEGNVQGVASIGEDVTEQRRAALEVRESRRQVLDILESIGDGFFALDNDWRFTYVNRRAEELIGIKRENLLFRNMWQVIPQAESSRIYQEYHHAKEHMVPVSFEEFLSPFNRWFEIHAYPYQSGLSVYFRDITDRKRAQEALEESEARFRAIFEQATYGIAMGTPDGIFVLYNKALEEIFGYTMEEINSAGGWLAVLYPDPEERAKHKEFDMRILQGRQTYFEYTITRKDGRKIWVSSSAVPVTVRGQAYLLGITQDINLRKQAEELSDTLNRINAAIISTFDEDEIMSIVVNESVKAIGTEQAGIVLREGNYWVYKHLYGAPEEFLGAHLTDEEIQYAALVVETKQPVVSNDAFNDKRFDPEYMRRISVRSFLAVPLVLHRNVIGILFYAYFSAPIPFTAAQVDFAAKLGTITSLALENARLYSLKKEVADTLQETLLSVPAHIEGIEFSHLYRAATEAARVGGDFYDIFTLKEGKVGISVGDISGTGVQAAILASMVKNAIRAYAYEDSFPAQVMSKTNELIRGTMGTGLFVTAFFGILDITTGQLIYCSAGHPPAILKRKTGQAELLITSSPILGAFSALNFIDDEATLKAGDIAVLYTDGVTEARCRNGVLFGEEQLVGLMKSLPTPISIKDIPKAVFDEVNECTGGTIADDIVVLSFGLANR